MKLGTAWIDITPSKPIPIAGQMATRLGEYKHDPLTVNAVVLEQDDMRIALISCDLLYLPDDFVREVQQSCENETGIPAASIIICCIHTHLAPYTESNIFGKEEESFMHTLHASLVEIVQQSVNDLEEVQIYVGSGWLEQMGFNRRGLYGNGKAGMYYGSWNDDFEGVEGPRDGEVGVIFAKKLNGDVKAVITSFSTHPNSVEMEHYYSADIAGAVRKFVRKNLGEEIGFVYLTGAAGNTAPSKLDDNKNAEMPWRGEEGWKRSGQYLGSEILKTIAGTIKPIQNSVLKLAQTSIDIPIKQWPESFDPNSLEDKGFRDYYLHMQSIWPKMLKENGAAQVHLNVIRIGDAVICTSPAELFVEFGLQIKECSIAKHTLISELTDGYVGYVPTPLAFEHGGYCTLPATSSLLDRCAGSLIVNATRQLIKDVFSN